MKITLDNIQRYWILSYVFNVWQMLWCNSYTMIYAYNRFTVDDKALLVLMEAVISLMAMLFIARKPIRRWVNRHPVVLASIGALLDGTTEYLLLVDPLYKYSFDLISLCIFFNFWKVQNQERMNTLFSDPVRRTNMDISINMATFVGGILAGVMAIIFKPDIVVVVWLSIFLNSTSYYISMFRFILADKYVAEHGLVYPCMREENK